MNELAAFRVAVEEVIGALVAGGRLDRIEQCSTTLNDHNDASRGLPSRVKTLP